nr:probable receptor-like protein kinase At5g59700 [Tanacetum cinerariifolium]
KRAPSPGEPVRTLEYTLKFHIREENSNARFLISKCRYENKPVRGHIYQHNGPVAVKLSPTEDTFQAEFKIVSRLQHENIIPFIGYLLEGREKCLVYEWAGNVSLSTYLHKLTWAERLKICIGAAKGLKYLHSGLGEYESVIHGEFTSQNILISDKLEAKICGFGSSFLVPRNNPDTKVYKKLVGGQEMDPVYRES